MPSLALTRVYRFCAGHRLWNPNRDEKWNRATFGKCSLPDGHGHNFRIEVTVSGNPDPDTGFLVSLDALDRAVRDAVLEPLDHRSLNVELAPRGFAIPTTEAVAQFAWRAIEHALSGGVSLRAIRLAETDNNAFEYFGD
ncbi:MAG: 6-carboxytetrahydropterin synthase [Planctomycetes bacterium]|nr:6-carboxytetrahydropterin synthase [Planctomycetota bacterium]MBI3845625.1 6-carboxytetrahydropterin synthase [Planctomycetota bacterium]